MFMMSGAEGVQQKREPRKGWAGRAGLCGKIPFAGGFGGAFFLFGANKKKEGEEQNEAF